MPAKKKSTKKRATKKKVAKKVDGFAQLRRRRRGPRIGSGLEVDEDLEAKSMTDLDKLIGGIEWLVPSWVPYGMLTMLMAEPGVGKSAFALHGLIRPAVTGCEWFSGALGPKPPGYVLLADTEGGSAITVQRLRDWQIPTDKILVPFAEDPLMPINLDDEDHIERMEMLINKFEIRLVVIDSLRGSHTGDENSSRLGNTLQQLSSLAERTKAAIAIIHHCRKLSVDEEISANSSRGSNVIQSLVRMQIGIDRPNTDDDTLRATVLKENLGSRPSPIGFRISKTGVEYCAAPRREPRGEKKESKFDLCVEFLQEQLSEEWADAAEIRLLAKKEGYSDNMVQRARESLGVSSENENIRKQAGKTEWKLPGKN